MVRIRSIISPNLNYSIKRQYLLSTASIAAAAVSTSIFPNSALAYSQSSNIIPTTFHHHQIRRTGNTNLVPLNSNTKRYTSSSSSSSSSIESTQKTTSTTTQLFEQPSANSESQSEPSNMNENQHPNPPIRIVSYNLLSSHLAEPTYHTKCKPENLSASNRLPKILAKLKKELDSNTNPTPIYCLQEVSHDWAKELHKFFANHGYHFITALYGRHFNGYMGIGIAYPIQHFETLDVDLNRLADTKQGGWPKPPVPTEAQAYADREYKIMKLFKKFVWYPFKDSAKYVGLLDSSRPNKSPWETSQYRSNEFIALKLVQRSSTSTTTESSSLSSSSSSTPFWIGNYHMPCAFREPAIMTIHAELVANRIQSLAKNDNNPYILAGDFNILPESSHYKLFTTGNMDVDEDDIAFPPLRYGTKWSCSDIKGMDSAYMKYQNYESDFTNWSHNGALSNESFIGTLDYIFVSDEWKVKDVLALKKRDDIVDAPFPNDEEPSDHVMIAATLQL